MGYFISNIVLLCTSNAAPEAYDMYANVNDNRIHVRIGYIVVRGNRFKVVAYHPETNEETLVIDKWQPHEDQFVSDARRADALEEAKKSIQLYIECL